MNKVVQVTLWGTTVGYLGYAPGQSRVATFEFDEDFARSGIQISPVRMACPPNLHSFDRISQKTFMGLAGIFADSLPDRFGNQLIDLYMAEKKIPSEKITPLDRLLYVGKRGVGALEYQPSMSLYDSDETLLDIPLLTDLANLVLSKKKADRKKLMEAEENGKFLELLRVGSSAGGARSKALVARTPGGRCYDGTLLREGDQTYWILKFDSDGNSDRDTSDPKGMPRVEYIYSLIARECGIIIPRTDYIKEGENFHFLIERFDRIPSERGMDKLHYASWAGLDHADRDTRGSYSYEQLALLIRRLGLGQDALNQLYRRAVFNVVGRNQDDHTKNFGFLMNRRGEWSLAPAFDLTYSYDPFGRWTRIHQIRLSGRQKGFKREDLIRFGKACNISPRKAEVIVDAVQGAFSRFEHMAAEYEVPRALAQTVKANLRMKL